MLSNNASRLTVWETLSDKHNYNEFVAACIKEDLPIMPITEFANKIGMLLVSKSLYPDMSTQAAYTEFAINYLGVPREIRSATIRNSDGTTSEIPLKPCCGGGEVR